MASLQQAVELAVEAHAAQEDPPGEPYILHPMRVMLAQPDEDHALRSVAILHDAVERGTLTIDRLTQAGFAAEVVQAINLLTHAKHVSYADYVIALKPHRLARLVKLADLRDNADLRFVDFPHDKPGKGKRRATRYVLSYQFLTNRIDEQTYRALMERAE